MAEIPANYKTRIPAYIKHTFLRNYLQILAIKILSTHSDFVFVDGFSGPWQAKGENFKDTSFSIAIDKLREARITWARRGKKPKVRAVFVEKSRRSFLQLKESVSTVTDVEILALHGRFEDHIEEIRKFVGSAFLFLFVDPKGWKVDIAKFDTLLQHNPSEVVFNFMFKFANRFKDDKRDSIVSAYEKTFAGIDWKARLLQAEDRSAELLECFRDVVKQHGRYEFVAPLAVLEPIADRTRYFLVFGTRQYIGLQVFRDVESGVLTLQESIRTRAKRENLVTRTNQSELFLDAPLASPRSVVSPLEEAEKEILRVIQRYKSLKRDDLYGAILERFAVRETEINGVIVSLVGAGKVKIEGLAARERTPKSGHIIRLAN